MAVNDGDILRVSSRWYGYHDQDIVNVWNFRANLTVPASDTLIFDSCDDFVTDVFMDFDEDYHTELEPRDMKVDVVDFIAGKWQVTHNVGYGSWGATIVTAKTDDVLPAGNACVVFLQTGLGAHQGRKFFGGFTELASSASGAVAPGVQTRVLAGADDLLTPFVIFTGNTLESVVLDRGDGTVRPVTSVSILGQWGYQRRRRPGVGS